MAIFADKRNGKVTGRWRVELQSGGKRLRKRFDTLDQARAFEAQARRSLARGEVPVEAKARKDKTGPETLDHLVRAVAGSLWAGKSTERQSLQRLEGAVRILGPSRLIESITVADTDRLVKVLRDGGSAPGTINRYLSALNVALKWALKRGFRQAPIPEMDWSDEDEGRIRWITPDEESRLLGFLPRPEALCVYIALRTGLRRGELLGLSKRDLEPSWIHLWGTGTKNGKGRSIPITPEVHAAVMEHLSLRKVTVESLRYHWNQAKQAMGLSDDEDFVFHCTRHTFATRAVQSGVHPRILQRLMGHLHITTTMRYMQVSDDMLSEAVKRMNHTGIPSTSLTMDSDVGALQVGGMPLNTPIDTARKTANTLRKQGVEEDLGSSGETRGGSSPSARTT